MMLKEKLKSGKVLCAEGYLFELERRGYVKAGPFVPEVVLDHPNAVKELHREFLRAGSDVMVAFTYYAHRNKMRVVDREPDLEKLNRQAIRLAKEVAQEGEAMVAGNISNTWVYDPEDEESHHTVREMYEEQVSWAKEEGVDYVIAETISYLGEALIALKTIKSFGLPAVVTLAPFYEKTLDGYEWEEACKILEDNGADVVGLNCGRGPDTMLPLLERVREKVSGQLAALPVPYHTTSQRYTFQQLKLEDGTQAFPVLLDNFLMNRRETAEFAVQAEKLGIDYFGLCCGGAPHHIRAMAEAMGRTVPASKYSPDLSMHPFVKD